MVRQCLESYGNPHSCPDALSRIEQWTKNLVGDVLVERAENDGYAAALLRIAGLRYSEYGNLGALVEAMQTIARQAVKEAV